MTYFESFVRSYFESETPALERNAAGDRWAIRLPVPVFVTVEVTEREVVSGRLSPRGFLTQLAARARAAVAAGVRQYEDGAEVPELRKRIALLEWERSE